MQRSQIFGTFTYAHILDQSDQTWYIVTHLGKRHVFAIERSFETEESVTPAPSNFYFPNIRQHDMT